MNEHEAKVASEAITGLTVVLFFAALFGGIALVLWVLGKFTSDPPAEEGSE